MVRRRDEKPYDPRGIIEKVAGGDVGKLDVVDGLEAGSLAADMLPGVGQVFGAPLDSVRGGMTAERERHAIEKDLGTNLAAARNQSRVMRRKSDELKGRSEIAFERSGVQAGAAFAGGAVMPLVGSFGGQYLAGKAMDSMGAAEHMEDQDAIGMVSQMKQMQASGQRVPAEMVFATLVANLPDGTGIRAENRLEGLTGTRKFEEALAEEKNTAISRLMPEFDTDLRADLAGSGVNIAFDPNNPRKTVSQQLADMINTGKINPDALILRDKLQDMNVVKPSVTPANAGRMPISNAEVQGIKAAMNQAGVTPGVDENGQPYMVPNKNKQPPGKA